MIGHYIEDDALDAFSLMGLLNGEDNLALTTSTSLNDFSDWVRPKDVDFILLDINRPDAVSMEKDVMRVREHSLAPIIFITGDEARFYRQEAVSAGAQAVVEKDNLTIQSLFEVLHTVATPKPRTVDKGDESNLVSPPELGDDKPLDSQKVGLVFEYLEEVHGSLADSDIEPAQLKSILKLLSGASRSFRSFYTADETGNDEQQSTKIAPPKLIRTVQEDALQVAESRNINFVFQIGVEAIAGFNNTARLQLGLRFLLHGLLIDAPPEGKVTLAGLTADSGLRLRVTSSGEMQVKNPAIFARKLPEDSGNSETVISLTLAAMLLGIKEDDVSLKTHGKTHTAIIDCWN
jgi:CheY-like chemotaxis protein